MRLVLDTCVLVAAIRSPLGASNFLLQTALGGIVTPLISVPLVLEYEAVLTRKEHLDAANISVLQAVGVVKSLCLAGEQVHLSYRLGPQLHDPNDEFVLETAFHGKADAIVTFNRRHFELAARSFGIATISPRDALERSSNS